ncbi:DNA-directed RNA polymerase I subunit [Astathelohania contejeani]|uniref:DNA-directed RNA polymerase subunit beta n=1 Tax=Astathelohania contejeani TaxID=164912 RepID=A0ABQ7HYI3_9MICR|nr:DNA-directed RNA polymerase I subunit [Thelohania contejeani]
MHSFSELVAPHIDAYNAFIKDIASEVISSTIPVEYIDNDGSKIRISVEKLIFHKPMLSEKESTTYDSKLLPRECRVRGLSYSGRILISLAVTRNGSRLPITEREAGKIPVMLHSQLCHLSTIGNEKAGEDTSEAGGYFIINGIEKVVRLLIAQKRNHVLAFKRASFAKKDKGYTAFCVSSRCVGPNEIGQTFFVHYCEDGNLMIRIFYRKREYLIPAILILKALIETNDEEIFNALTSNDDNEIAHKRINILLTKLQNKNLHSRKECLTYLGSHFKNIFKEQDYTEDQAGEELLKRTFAVHLHSSLDKFNFLIYAIQKLYAFVDGKIKEDDLDAPMNHEVFTLTQLFSCILQDKLDDILRQCIVLINKKDGDINEALEKVDFNIGNRIESFLATGNLSPNCASDILQTSGFVVVAEKINYYRFISHFRCINRGSFFQTIKVTSVRKLRPESWGFLCPVHTPDGAPCGLLTHLAHRAIVSNIEYGLTKEVLYKLGIIPYLRGIRNPKDHITVLLDGKLIGFIKEDLVGVITRYRNKHKLICEIVYIPQGFKVYPGVFIFTGRGRLMRPVLFEESIEWIGMMEQVFKKISLNDDKSSIEEFQKGYKEIDCNIFSLVAGLTPFSHFNQSPRSMYQCQMAKQTMGIHSHNIVNRADNKSYWITYPQNPIVRTSLYDLYPLSNYPIGINAIVAVLSYTAYDMEDAMVINKSSLERGFFYGHVYKCFPIEVPVGGRIIMLPDVGSKIRPGDVLYTHSLNKAVIYKDFEEGYIHSVQLFEPSGGVITIRIPRNPTIGDKFCSRHGQKGVCSMHWPTIDMPFTEDGIVPDIIINPHAFPSRMTIGMLVESMAGKSGCLLGKSQDGSVFGPNEDPVNTFGEELKRCGYNYHGNEIMYSGITGNELKTDIYIGVVYYQRLRHMVSDKFQVRTNGPVQAQTRQPVGGRKHLGGVRFGEMERDCLIGHGIAYTLRDRLLNCSDYTEFSYCVSCESIIFSGKNKCICGGIEFKTVAMPYVFKYLCSELMGMNIRVKLSIE